MVPRNTKRPKRLRIVDDTSNQRPSRPRLPPEVRSSNRSLGSLQACRPENKRPTQILQSLDRGTTGGTRQAGRSRTQNGSRAAGQRQEDHPRPHRASRPSNNIIAKLPNTKRITTSPLSEVNHWAKNLPERRRIRSSTPKEKSTASSTALSTPYSIAAPHSSWLTRCYTA